MAVQQTRLFSICLGIHAGMLWDLGCVLRHVTLWIGGLPWSLYHVSIEDENVVEVHCI